MKKKKVKVKFCPNCGSLNIGISAAGKIPRDICQECGYGGIMLFPRVDISKIKEIRKEIRKRGKLKKIKMPPAKEENLFMLIVKYSVLAFTLASIIFLIWIHFNKA